MSRKVKCLVVAFLVLSVSLWHIIIPVNSVLAETPLWNLDERPQTKEELLAQLPWYLKDYQVDEEQTAWNAITPTEGGNEAYKGRVAVTLPLLGDSRMDISITIERGVAYEPTAEDLARVNESGLPVYGFIVDLVEKDGQLITTTVGYIPEAVLEQTDVTAESPGNRLPATSASGTGQCVKVIEEIANAASLGTTVKGAWDTMGRHERLLRMLDLANDIVDNEARDRIISILSAIVNNTSAQELIKGGVGIASIVLVPATGGASLVVGVWGYLHFMAVDWVFDKDMEAIKQEMIDLGVDFDRPVGTVDKAGLEALVSEIEQLDEADFTAASWLRLTNALAEGRLRLSDPDTSQHLINRAIEWLSTARSAMEENLSGFDVAQAVAGEKKRGTDFGLKITRARNEYGLPLGHGVIVTVTSNLENGTLYDGEVIFTNGNATVPIILYTDGEHTLTIRVAEVSRPRTLAVTVVVSQEAWHGIITIDDKHDFRPRTDGICDTWVKRLSETVDVITAAVMYRDESGIKQVGTIAVSARLASPLATIRLEIDKGWVFWQFRNVDAKYESWVYDPDTDQSIRIVTAADADAYASSFQFQNGKVLWVDNYQGLMFFNGLDTIKLADKGNFFDCVFNVGWVVWRERPVGSVAWNASHIKLYNGSDILNLSEMGDASDYIGHFQAATDGGRVVWKGMKYQNTSIEDIFFYDGNTVRRLTTDNPGPIRHLQFWMDQVVWQLGPYELYLWNGQEKARITDSLPAETMTSIRRHWGFLQGKVVWHEYLDFQQAGNAGWWDGPTGPIHVYDTATKISRQLPWEGSQEDQGWSIRNLQFDGQGVFWAATRFLGDPRYVYQHVLKLYNWEPDRILTIDEYDDPAGYYFLSFYQRGHVAWSRRKHSKHARWWFWTVPDAGGAKHWTTGMLDDDAFPYYDAEIFRYSPDTGIQKLTRRDPEPVDAELDEPDDAQLEGLSNGRVIWTGLRLPARNELPQIGPIIVSGSIWIQRDSWREIYARNIPVSFEDFSKSAIRGLSILYGKNIDPALSENDFNKNGKLDLGDIIYAFQKASGSR